MKVATIGKANVSETFCPLPFVSVYGTASGEIVPCCESQDHILSLPGETLLETWNAPALRQLRLALMAGQQPKACEKCWRNEREGFWSNRQQALRDMNEKFFGPDDLHFFEDGRVLGPPRFLELKTSNICNLKCRMCYVDSSHRVLEDIEIIREYRIGIPERDKPLRADRLLKDIERNLEQLAESLIVLQFSGGEPLLSREQFELTSKIAERFGERVDLRYSTNLTHLRFEEFDVLSLWRKFRHVNVKVSVDGIYDVYNYIRVGANFDRVLENFEKVKALSLDSIDLNIGFTTQAYNAFQLLEFIEFFSKRVARPRISTHLLYSPNFMCIDVYPEEIRDRLRAKLKGRVDIAPEIDQFFAANPVNEDTQRRWSKLLEYTDRMEAKYGLTGTGFRYLLSKYL
jgi:pyruvate-formate lyase-activating enzyme